MHIIQLQHVAALHYAWIYGMINVLLLYLIIATSIVAIQQFMASKLELFNC